MHSLGKVVFKLGAASTFVSACCIVFFLFAGESVFKDVRTVTSGFHASQFSVPQKGGLYETCISIPILLDLEDFDMTATVSILDSEQESPIYIYEESLWQASGRDLDGPWTEGSMNECESFVIDHDGLYSMELEIEMSQDQTLGATYTFELTKKHGSFEPWLLLFAASIFLSFLASYFMLNEF